MHASERYIVSVSSQSGL